ncbi:MAG: hypothetical protein AAB257_05620 [Nitrospinota bacterium]
MVISIIVAIIAGFMVWYSEKAEACIKENMYNKILVKGGLNWLKILRWILH